MRRLKVKRIVGCGALGAACAWSSTWAIATAYSAGVLTVPKSGRFLRPRDLETLPPEVGWPFGVPEHWPEPGAVFRVRSWGLTSVQAQEHPDVIAGSVVERKPGMRWCTVVQIRYGWPWRTLERRFLIEDLLQPSGMQAVLRLDDQSVWDQGISVPLGSRGRPADLPIRPLWPGFAVNAAFYAGVCWVLLFAPGVVVRWRRRRNGRCPACGYELAGLERCSECGGVP